MSEARGAAPAAGASAVERWSAPQVEGPRVARPREERAAGGAGRARDGGAERAAAEERGYQEGLARAQAQMQAGIAELQSHARHLEAVLQRLRRPLEELDAEVEEQLLRLAVAIGQQLARRELSAEPAQLIAIVRSCLEQLPAASREVRIHVNPADAAVLRARLAAPGEARAWVLVDDPALTRGGCLVRAENSEIDARFESRVHAIVAAALGEERSPLRSGAAPGSAPGAPA
jgi:flagellar assembly protein FliH